MRRLLAVCAVHQPGGAEIGLFRLLRRLAASGWAIEVAAPGPAAPSGGRASPRGATPAGTSSGGGTSPSRGGASVAQLAAAEGWAFHRVEVGGLDRGAGARAVLSWPRVRRLSRGADVVYLNGGVPGRLLPALRGRRTVLHLHDIVARVPGHWRAAGVVLADSTAVAEALPGLESHVVGCPVELDLPAADPPWPPGDGPVIGFVGRIEPRKGPLTLVEAAPLIRQRRPDARVVLVGDDPYASNPSYFERVRAGHAVEHFGWVDDAASILGHLDVLTVPSTEEPFGTVAAEAMAAGTPVVASAVGGLNDVVEDTITGRLVPPSDPHALADAVLDVLARRDEMGEAARARARRFGAEAYALRVGGLLDDLVRGGAGGRA